MSRRLFFMAAMLLLVAFAANGQNLTRQQYINKYKDVAIRQMHKHKIPASIILAQACLESGDGNSTLARKANNHFGIKCHNGWKGKAFKHDDDAKGECFRKYNDPVDSYTDHSYFLISGDRYNSLFDLPENDYKAWAHGLKAAGYATNPKYAKLLIDIIEEYKLYQYDTKEAAKLSKASLKEAKKAAKKEKKLRKLEKKAAKAAMKSEKAALKVQKFKGSAAGAAAATAATSAATSAAATTAAGASAATSAAATTAASSSSAATSAKIKSPVQSHPAGEYYTIKGGDTLYSIARRYGTSVDEITRLNPGIKATELEIGTQIRIK